MRQSIRVGLGIFALGAGLATTVYVLAAPASYPWPRHLCERFGEQWAAEQPLVSNGPYLLDDFRDDGLTLVANPRFDGPRGNLREVEVQYRSAGSDPVARWNGGEFDALSTAHALGESDERTELTVAPALGSLVGILIPCGCAERW